MSSQEPERAAMAAVPGEAPVPLAAPVLPLAKRLKKDPVLPATVTADWSSLPPELVRRIADFFLDTNDLDWYMGFRAVCPSWRAATDDPKNNALDPRFCPRTWVILDEVFQSDTRRLLVNAETGRFLHMELLLLRNYYVVCTTTGGFFVLADRSPPHAARLFNPLTGAVIRFAAPVPPEAELAQVACVKDEFALYLLGDSSAKVYMAIPDSEDFFSRKVINPGVHIFFRSAILGGAYPHISSPVLLGAFTQLCDLIDGGLSGDANNIQFLVVGLDTNVVVFNTVGGRTPFVFKINTEIGKLLPVQSIGRFAIFIGHYRSLAVDADKFPGIEANCVYYAEDLGLSAHICKCNIKDKKVERISEAAEFLKQDKKFVLVADRPFTIIQLLCSYTINYSGSELASQKVV